jgi:hypothetical protein
MRRRRSPSSSDPAERLVFGLAVLLSVACGWLVVYATEPHVPGDDGHTATIAAFVASDRAARTAPTATTAATATTTRAATPRAAAVATPAQPATPTQPARAPTQVRVRVDASARPTFLCVEDGQGRQLYAATLDRTIVFVGRHLRLNIGLSTTRITVDGHLVALPESPAGLDITPAHGAKDLPLGQRPCR